MGSGIGGDDDVISLELRLTAINHGGGTARSVGPLLRAFRSHLADGEGAPDADLAFEKYTGLSIAEYLALGFAVSAGFAARSVVDRLPGLVLRAGLQPCQSSG